jgi:hypothetical protein
MRTAWRCKEGRAKGSQGGWLEQVNVNAAVFEVGFHGAPQVAFQVEAFNLGESLEGSIFRREFPVGFTSARWSGATDFFATVDQADVASAVASVVGSEQGRAEVGDREGEGNVPLGSGWADRGNGLGSNGFLGGLEGEDFLGRFGGDFLGCLRSS